MVLSKKRVIERERKEKAYFDYILADTIGHSVGRLCDEKSTYPCIEDVYPDLYNSKERQEEKQKQQEQISILRFKQFAENLNRKFNKEVATNE